MKIGLYGWYGYNNWGDDLMLDTLITAIRETMRFQDDIEIIVFCKSTSIRIVQEKYPEATVVSRDPNNVLKSVFTLDLFLLGTGGLFPHKNPFKIGFYVILASIMRLRNKTIGMLGLGISTINYTSLLCTNLLKILLILCNSVVFRHEPHGMYDSPKYSHLIYASDIAFSRINKAIYCTTPKERKKKVVIALANIFERNEKSLLEFVTTIVLLIKYLLEQKFQIKLIPFAKGVDEILNNHIAHEVDNDFCVSLPYLSDLKAMCDVYSQCEYAISMRFHAIVVSVLTQTPTCAIAYSDKLEFLMNDIGFKNYCRRFSIDSSYYKNIESINSSMLINDFERMRNDKSDMLNKLLKNREAIQDRADINIAELNALLFGTESYTT